MSDDGTIGDEDRESEEEVAEHVSTVVGQLVHHALQDARSVGEALEAIRGEMRVGFNDLRGDVKETQRLQRETNGKVAELDTAVANILAREKERLQRERDRALLWADRKRPLRFLWRVARAVFSQGFVLRAGIALLIGLLGAEKVGVL